MGQASRKAIWKYLSTREPAPKPQEPLFATRTGTHIDRNALGNLIESCAKRAGVEHAYPHRFRHTFAITFLRNGGSPLELQALLGHEKLDTVNIYVRLAQVDLQEAQKYAPVRRTTGSYDSQFARESVAMMHRNEILRPCPSYVGPGTWHPAPLVSEFAVRCVGLAQYNTGRTCYRSAAMHSTETYTQPPLCCDLASIAYGRQRRSPIHFRLAHALHSRPATHNPFTPRTFVWVHYLVGYQYGLRISRMRRTEGKDAVTAQRTKSTRRRQGTETA